MFHVNGLKEILKNYISIRLYVLDKEIMCNRILILYRLEYRRLSVLK